MESLNYHLEDFTESSYRELLKITKGNFNFIKYPGIHTKDSFILWRHDIDFSVHRSMALAKIENEEGVHSTYFVQLNSAFYNIFENEIKQILKDVKLLGHDLALHFDFNAYKIKSDSDLEKYLIYEKDILETLLNINIKAFSFHNTTTFDVNKYDKLSYAGMINTYSKYFKENVRYCSDSNGYWKNDRLEDVLRKSKDKRLQVLTHPAWWQKTPMNPRERVARCIEGRAKKQYFLYAKLLKEYGRENIG